MFSKFIIFLFVVLFVVNRLFLLIEQYNIIKSEIESDEIFYIQNCLQSEKIRLLGKRSYICDEIKQKSNFPILVHAVRYVFDSTLYYEFTIDRIAFISLVLIIVYSTDYYISKFTKSLAKQNASLPSYIQHIKND